jgi:hypothetical protein
MKINILKTIALILIITFMIGGCVEHRYYHHYHRHSPEYLQRHNM